MNANARQCEKTGFCHVRRIRQLHHQVDYETLYMLVCALMLSRLDYCNSLFARCSKSTSLQRVQDAAARLFCNAHITTVQAAALVTSRDQSRI